LITAILILHVVVAHLGFRKMWPKVGYMYLEVAGDDGHSLFASIREEKANLQAARRTPLGTSLPCSDLLIYE
jgi:hypothetical protein